MCCNKQLTNGNKNSKSPNVSNSRRKVHTVHIEDTSSDTNSEPQVFIHALQVHDIMGSSWLSTVHTEGGKITFKLDTGAEASILPMKVYKKLKRQPMIDSTDTMLSAYGGSVIKPVSTCNLTCGSKVGSSTIMFYVVSIAAQAILGLEDCITLGLIQRVHAIQVQVMLKEIDFGDVFKDLGNIGDYHITLKDGITPVIHPPQRVPHSLLGKLKHCLDVNLRYGVLKKVDEPTDWVHNPVIVEKNGSLRLCLDPQDLNKAVKRENYKIASAHEVSSHLSGKRIFSTLDLKDGFW